MRRTTRSLAAAAGEVAAWWLVLTALYLVLISDVTLLEFAVGAAGAVLAAVAARLARTAAEAGTGGGGRALAAALHWPAALLTDTARLAAVTAGVLCGRPAPGCFRVLRLRPGTGAAWAGALLSATPGAYVVDVGRYGEEDTGGTEGEGACGEGASAADASASAADASGASASAADASGADASASGADASGAPSASGADASGTDASGAPAPGTDAPASGADASPAGENPAPRPRPRGETLTVHVLTDDVTGLERALTLGDRS
ncbi:hypothetical protein POF50_007605 [Streptomyces sp. SL13]|uniref:Uncharacterized protein n=1 Tax=Streptantibioticus silvisoli TaxID=2705255 RepID=A0AA90KFF4_9ACTN|nr:hypothetical protein [Streptantibioticus silvisoli]MDI5969210.1 hypothetical protein [Streptantibioticus silvisoli]